MRDNHDRKARSAGGNARHYRRARSYSRLPSSHGRTVEHPACRVIPTSGTPGSTAVDQTPAASPSPSGTTTGAGRLTATRSGAGLLA